MQKTNINPAIYQQFLESASNAGDKGQAQYFTPQSWGKALGMALPYFRPVIIDLNCGAGHLLQAVARGSTNHLLGCDIDPGEPETNFSGVKRITADVFKLLPLFRAVGFEGDCFTLNPPWDLHLYRANLAGLAEGGLPTVRAAFAAHDGRTGKDTIDSTVATLCLALDLCSRFGEGFIIANESTLQRLILGPDAPHGALAIHCWAHVVVQGNITDPASGKAPSEFQTGVLYFARDHDIGLPSTGSTLYRPPPLIATLQEAELVCARLHKERLNTREGAEIKNHGHTDVTTEKWLAVAAESERLIRKDRPQYNLTLWGDGTIRTDLSLFDTASNRVTKAEADSLFELGGKHPMQLVMKREQRRHLERAAFGTTWRVDPALQSAIHNAVEQYHKIRAPLYPLSPIMRLGYLDEQDNITCTKTVLLEGAPVFSPDRIYAIRSTTVQVKRSGEKYTLSGGYDEVEWDGQELAFFITDDRGIERVFMEGRLRVASVKISVSKPDDRPKRGCPPAPPTVGGEDPPCPIDFTLHELVEHFTIPDVPDVARVNPVGYQQKLLLLKEIESLCV